MGKILFCGLYIEKAKIKNWDMFKSAERLNNLSPKEALKDINYGDSIKELMSDEYTLEDAYDSILLNLQESAFGF